MLPPTSFDDVSTIGVSAVTVTASLSAPTSRRTSTVVVLPTSIRTSRCVAFRKPSSSADTS